MKNIFLSIYILIFSIITVSTQAQIKVNSDGQVKVFGDKPNDDLNKDLSMQVYGQYGEYLANGRIGIGDYGRVANNGSNIFIGELGTNWDSDKLQLHGKKGIYLTWGQGYDYNSIIGKWDITQPDRFQFETDVYAKSILLQSDERFKENIKPLKKKLSDINKLNGISYNLKEEFFMGNPELIDAVTEKEKQDKALLEETKTKMNKNKKTRLCFVAQDVQAIFPELVDQDSSGNLYVDYVGLIPVLVESIKEQQKQIDELKELAIKEGFIK